MSAVLAPLSAAIDDAVAHGARREVVAYWQSVYASAPAGPAAGTLKAWMQAHNGATVETFQWDVRPGKSASPWAPGPRTVDASRASYVTLDGSRRDYSGVRVVATGPDSIMVTDDWHAMIYRAMAS